MVGGVWKEHIVVAKVKMVVRGYSVVTVTMKARVVTYSEWNECIAVKVNAIDRVMVR